MANTYGKSTITVDAAGNTVGQIRYNNTQLRYAQSITAISTDKITYCYVYIGRTGNPVGNIWIKLYAAGADPTASTLLGTSDLVDASIVPATPGLFKFIFSTPVQETNGNQYYAVIDGDYSISTTNFIFVWRNSTTASYAGGNSWIDNNGTWVSQPTVDMRMVIYTNQDGGAYDIDTDFTDTNVNRMALKGGASQSVLDSFFTYKGAKSTGVAGETYYQKLISWGETSLGAWPVAAEKYGKLEYVGCNLVFAGDATNTNSGIKGSPATPDPTFSKLGETVFVNCIMTNDGNAVNTSKKWTIASAYGKLRIENCVLNNSYSGPLGAIGIGNSLLSAPMNNVPPIFLNNNIDGLLTTTGAAVNIGLFPSNTSVDMLVDFRGNYVNAPNIVSTSYVTLPGIGAGCKLVSGGTIDTTGTRCVTQGGTASYFGNNILYNSTNPYYINTKISFADIRPTQTVPTGLAFVDQFDGTVRFTITNPSAYVDKDVIVVFDNTGLQRACIPKSHYIANGYGIINVPVGTKMENWYAKATSDTATYSAASAVAPSITTAYSPRITGISDPTADVAGGQTRILTGAGLTGASAVTIGETAATSYVVNSDTQITVTLPAKAAGVYDIAVTVDGVTWTESGLIKYLALAAAPGAFTIWTEAWGVNSIKVGLNPSTGANSYRVYRDNVDVSGSFVAGSYIDTVSPGTYAYKVKATNETGDTFSNTVTITKVAGGLSDMYSMLSMLYKAIISCRIGFVKESSTHYLLVYDTDGTTVLSKCAMKTFDGLDIADLAGTTTPSIRNGSTVTGSGEELELSMWDMLSGLFKNEFYKRNKVEYPIGSGHIHETLYDNDDTTVIDRQLLEKFGGGDIGSLVDTTTPSYRGRSSV